MLHFLAGAGGLGVFDGPDLLEKGFLIIIAGLGLPDRIPGGFCLDLISYRKSHAGIRHGNGQGLERAGSIPDRQAFAFLPFPEIEDAGMPVVSKIHIVRKQLAGCGIKGNQPFAVEGDAGGGLRGWFFEPVNGCV